MAGGGSICSCRCHDGKEGEVSIREALIKIARLKGLDVGDEAMITQGEWGYWISGVLYISKSELRKFMGGSK